MGFASGFNAGYTAAADGLESRKKRKAEEEVVALGSEAGAVKGTGLKITAPDGTVSTGVVDDATDFDTVGKQYEAAGYKVERMAEPQYAARSGEGRDHGGTYATEAEAEAGSRKVNYGLTRKKADVYSAQGLDDQAKEMRKEARAMESHDQQSKLTGLQIDDAQANADSRETTAKFYEDVNTNPPKTPQEWQARAKQFNLPMDEQWKVLGTVAKIDTEVHQQVQAAQIRDFDAGAKKGLGGLLEATYNNEKNPMWADGKTASVVETEGGIAVVDSDGNTIAQGATELEVLAQMRASLQDPATAFAFHQDQVKFKMDQQKGESTINLQGAQARNADASARESDAKAGLYSRTDPNLKDGNGSVAQRNSDIAAANSLSTQIANIDRAMPNVTPGSPEHKTLVAQRNAAFTRLNDLNTKIHADRVPQTEGGGAPQVSDASAARAMTIAAKAVQSGKATIEEANAELRAEGLPELDPADFTGKKPVGLTSKQPAPYRLPTFDEVRAKEAERNKPKPAPIMPAAVPGYRPLDARR